MKCIVKGCQNEASENMLCAEHYDPEKKPAPAAKAHGAKPGGLNFESRLSLAAHTLFLISGKIAGRIVRSSRK
jgi:hypothetical protein